MSLETNNKKLEYRLADPDNQEHIEQVSLQEREGFGTGIDPQELPEVIAFIAKNGHVWLQYAIEGTARNPTGVIELISLEKALKIGDSDIAATIDVSDSPLNVITGNKEAAFQYARRFADDKDITYHHGISMSIRGRGYGTLLLNHALNNTPNLRNRLLNCFIDAAKIDVESGKLMPAANESSYTVHMKAGFVLTGVVEPPVYDDKITYYSVVRPSDLRQFQFSSEKKIVMFHEPDVNKTILQIRDLTSQGYVGVSYDRKTHEMTFKKIIS